MNPSTNGHAHHESNGKAEKHKAPAAVNAVRILRVDLGETIHVRTLSPELRGLFTHYHRGRSQVCFGKDCRFPCAKMDRVWKGYFAGESWNARIKRWQPAVVEVTEALELDLRGLFGRGQVWEFWRMPSGDGNAPPVMGKLLEQRDAATFPVEFDFISPLRTMYHVVELPPHVKNPLPPRVLLADSEDAGPAILEQPERKLASAEEVHAAIEAAKARMSGVKTPTEKKAAR